MGLVVCLSLPILTSTIKLSLRIVSLLCPASPIVLSLIAITKKTFGISTCDTSYSFPPSSLLSIPIPSSHEQSCPPYALAIPKPDVRPSLLIVKTILTFIPSTRSDNGRTSAPCFKHCVAYTARLHFPYQSQPF